MNSQPRSSDAIRIDLDESAIRRLVADAETFQNDVERFTALLTNTVVIVNIAGIRVEGQADFRRVMAAALETRLAKVLTKTDVLDTAFLRPDVAIVNCVKYVSDTNEDAAAQPSRGSLTFVVLKEGDTWRIALAQTTPVLG